MLLFAKELIFLAYFTPDGIKIHVCNFNKNLLSVGVILFNIVCSSCGPYREITRLKLRTVNMCIGFIIGLKASVSSVISLNIGTSSCPDL